MYNLPLFEGPKNIEDSFGPTAHLVLYHGDVSSFVANIPDKSISLIITSPLTILAKITKIASLSKPILRNNLR